MSNDRHLDELDGMRGLAVLIVLLSHSSGREMPLAPWLNFVGIGHVGVYLFFVLSSYLLTRNLIDGQTTGQFYMRRVFRIMPLYYCTLAGVLIYQANNNYSLKYLHISDGFQGAVLHFLFLKGDSVFWTLAAEFGFYLILPLIVSLIRHKGWKWLAATAVVYFLLFIFVEKFKLHWIPLKFVDISHRSQFLDVFICGILAAYIPWRYPHKWVPLAFWGLLALTVIGVSANVLNAGQPFYSLRWFSLLYGVVFAMAIVSAVEGHSGLLKPLRHPLFSFLGRIGFGLYLLHFPVFQMVNAFVPAPPAVRFCIALPAACALAWFAYQTIEIPMLRLGRKLEVRLGVGRALQSNQPLGT